VVDESRFAGVVFPEARTRMARKIHVKKITVRTLQMRENPVFSGVFGHFQASRRDARLLGLCVTKLQRSYTFETKTLQTPKNAAVAAGFTLRVRGLT
jgi:hypothetical protein